MTPRQLPTTDWPRELEVVIEVPRFGFVKRRDDGGVDFVTPVPSPFNYGYVPGTRAGDGDREDAIVLGPRRSRIVRFFRIYTLLKRVLHALRRKRGRTAYEGLDLAP